MVNLAYYGEQRQEVYMVYHGKTRKSTAVQKALMPPHAMLRKLVMRRLLHFRRLNEPL